MLEEIIGAALLIIVFSVGYVLGSHKMPPKPEKSETVEEMMRKKNFKRFMEYDGSGNTN